VDRQICDDIGLSPKEEIARQQSVGNCLRQDRQGFTGGSRGTLKYLRLLARAARSGGGKNPA
jgi:hypothetical protein